MDKHPRFKLLQGPILAVYILLLASALATRPGWVTAGEAETVFRIEILAGNGKPGDIPEGGGNATEIPVDLPFGVENGSDGALYITTVGSHRVLRLRSEEHTS